MFYAAWLPVRWTAQSDLLFTPWQTCSFRHQLAFSGTHSSHAQLPAKLFTHISTTACSQVGGTHLYSWVNWDVVGRTEMQKLRNFIKFDFFPEEFPRTTA